MTADVVHKFDAWAVYDLDGNYINTQEFDHNFYECLTCGKEFDNEQDARSHDGEKCR